VARAAISALANGASQGQAKSAGKAEAKRYREGRAPSAGTWPPPMSAPLNLGPKPVWADPPHPHTSELYGRRAKAVRKVIVRGTLAALLFLAFGVYQVTIESTVSCYGGFDAMQVYGPGTTRKPGAASTASRTAGRAARSGTTGDTTSGPARTSTTGWRPRRSSSSRPTRRRPRPSISPRRPGTSTSAAGSRSTSRPAATRRVSARRSDRARMS
jgi:hypothetical protein